MQSIEGDVVALKGKGHRVTKLPKQARPAHRKGKLNKHVKFVRDVVREVGSSCCSLA